MPAARCPLSLLLDPRPFFSPFSRVLYFVPYFEDELSSSKFSTLQHLPVPRQDFVQLVAVKDVDESVHFTGEHSQSFDPESTVHEPPG